MVDIFASGGAEELSKRISDRLALQPRNGNTAHYLLADAQGHRIAGDIRAWPGLRPASGGGAEIRLGNGGNAFARTTHLSPGLRLVVAPAHHAPDVLLHQVPLASPPGVLLAAPGLA